MPSIKNIALAATLATTAVAYSTPLEARNDLDFAPEDLDVLFARDLDFSPEDLEILFARDPSLFSSVAKIGSKIAGSLSKHSGSISKVGSKVGHGVSRGADAYSMGQQIKSQSLQNQQMQIQNQQMARGGGGGGYYKRDVLDDEDMELIARDLDLDVEDVEYLVARGGAGALVSKVGQLFSKHKDTIGKVGRHGVSAAQHGGQLYGQAQMIHSQSLMNDQMKAQNQMMQQQGNMMPQQGVYRRDLFEEEDPETWY